MISPRVTRLHRVDGLRAFQHTICELVPRGWSARATAVLVPTTSAAEELRRTLEEIDFGGAGAESALVLPDIVTRGELYARCHQRLADAPPLLSAFEREVLLRLAAEDAEREGFPPPFRLRPGLVAAMLAFYDELRRHGRSIDTLDRIVGAKLEAGRESDRGAERLFRQTQFLAASFAALERRTGDSGRIDEHGLRSLLASSAQPVPYEQVIVTVADQAADTLGLWPVDFDLLARLPGITRLDVVATEEVLAAGWHERVHAALPELDELRRSAEPGHPRLLAPRPAGDSDGAPLFVCRDREEELVEAARWIKERSCREAGARLDEAAVVFQRPLPYLYLAGQVFASAAIPFEAADALPLAAEPFAAALDLIFSVAIEDASRASLVALLGSAHWRFTHGGRDGALLTRDHVRALDQMLLEAKFLGGWGTLQAIADRPAPAGGKRHRERRSLAAPALGAALELRALFERMVAGTTVSAQLDAVLRFTECHRDTQDGRYERGRAAILAAVRALREAHVRYDDRPVPVADLWATVRRWIEGQTFSPRSGTGGVRLVDARAAAYARVEAARLVGLVESDWPERTTGSIFYPRGLLRELGWPDDGDRLSAARAAFGDLLRLPGAQVSASTFTLEDDAIVAPSAFVEVIAACGLAVQRQETAMPVRIFVHEALSMSPLRPDAVSGDAAAWLELRLSRTDSADRRYHGAVGARPAGIYAVSQVERYLECPFKFFAAHVLRLEEERDDESGLTPLERGQLLHGVFEAFYRRWAERGGTGMSAANLDEALALFAEVAEDALGGLPEADRALERTYLLGSAASPGLAERAFALEIEHGVEVAERLLEHVLEGEFAFAAAEGVRRIGIRGKADRIDVLADGTLRLIDYKLGRAPKAATALQLPIYGVCAQQQLERARGGRWPLSKAGYVAFKEKNAFCELGGRGDLETALREGQQRFVEAVTAIEAGEYPADPEEVWTCNRCGFPHVCRKDYVGDE